MISYRTWSEIELVNAQSIEHAIIELPKTGIVRFFGRNRNGKSIFEKWLEESVSGRISRPRVRKSLIRRGTNQGMLRIRNYNDQQIKIVVNKESSKTYIEYDDFRLKIHHRRYISDKKESIITLFRMFGLHYNEKRDMSLNIYKTFGPIIFQNTSYVENFDMLSEALSDQNVDSVIEKEEMFLAEQDVEKEKILKTIETFTQKRQILDVYDEEKELTKYKLFTTYEKILSALTIPSLPELGTLPDLSLLGIPDAMPELPVLQSTPDETVKIIDILGSIPELPEIAIPKEMSTIEVLMTIPDIPQLGSLPDLTLIDSIHTDEILDALSLRLPSLDSLLSDIQSLEAINGIPVLQSLDLRALPVEEFMKFDTLCSEPPMLPDIADELTRATNMYDAIKNKVCPLCGNSILKEGE